MFSAQRVERPPLRPPAQLTPEPREGTPAGLAQSMVQLLDGLGSSRTLGPKQAGRDPAPPPAQLFPPMFVVPKEARRCRAPAPPYWPAQSRARNQLGPAGASRGRGLRGGPARGAWAAAGGTDSAPGSRGRLSARRRAASFLLAGGRVGVQPLYSATPLFCTRFYRPM